MPATKKDPEISALEAVHMALKPLDREARRKVLASVYALLEISGVELMVQPPMRQDQPTGGTRSTEPTLRGPSTRPVALVELMQEKAPGTNAQRIALFAYYRDKHEGLSRFERNDLRTYFAKAKEQPPTNYDRDFVEAVKKGWLHEDGKDSYITSKGIEAVEAGFPGERKYTKPPKPRPRPRGGKAKVRRKKPAKTSGTGSR